MVTIHEIALNKVEVFERPIQRKSKKDSPLNFRMRRNKYEIKMAIL
jgi:hypothetical protein